MKGETYEEFVAKFQEELPKTTDDCYTPKEVWQVIVNYVKEKYNVEESQIVRPFYPGGNYEDLSQYDEDCFVVDNPPFSILSKIVDFYDEHKIKYFLFMDGKTFAPRVKDNRTVIHIQRAIIFENGAQVRCAFITNLENEYAIRYDAKLSEDIEKANRPEKKEARKHEENCYSGAQFIKLCRETGRNFKHDELEFIREDKYGKLFGGGFRIKKGGE